MGLILNLNMPVKDLFNRVKQGGVLGKQNLRVTCPKGSWNYFFQECANVLKMKALSMKVRDHGV